MYQTFYKFRGKPFQLTPDLEFLYPSRGHKRAMSYLLYGFEQGEGFVMITGAVGTGKTLLIQTLTQRLMNRNIAIANIASANLDGPDILPAVASAFKLPYEGRSREALYQDVKWHLVTLRAHHTHALLIVDEAQTLTPAALEVLRVLSNLEVSGHALLQVFLIGQTELRRTIVSNHMEQLRQRVIASYRLEPMVEEESRAYILHRLHAVGWNSDPSFSPDVFLELQRASRGIPRKINLIMDRLLLYGYLEELHELDATALHTVLAEMQDEMSGIPSSLEMTASSEAVDMSRATAVSEPEIQLASLEIRLNTMLKQLREKIQRKESQQMDLSDPAISKRPVVSSARRTSSKHEEK